MKKRGLFIVVFSFVLLVFGAVYYFVQSSPTAYITGNVPSGVVSIFVEGGIFEIYIVKPLNTTYNFAFGSNYTLDLEVHSPESNISSWWYQLYDLKHNSLVREKVYFTPNSTFNAVRWSNELTVFANNSAGEVASKSVVFYVQVPDTAPIISNLSSEYFVCEGNEFVAPFIVTDYDEGTLIATINPQNPFWVYPESTTLSSNSTIFQIISGFLSKSNLDGVNTGYKTYNEEITISDGLYSDSKRTNITLIEINNAPVINDLGVQTIWTSGDNSTFYKAVNITDLEDGIALDGNLNLTLQFLNSGRLFNISRFGIINFTPSSSQVGVYNISLCAFDNGLSVVHPNISLCNQDGKIKGVCQNFSLTITDKNRPPTITSFAPSLNYGVDSLGLTSFNITAYDPDGTTPDVYWYLNGVLKLYGSGANQYIYQHQCGAGGLINLSVFITDGLEWDSLSWNVSTKFIPCSSDYSGTSGGGGGQCVSKWVCSEWSVCQNTEKSLSSGIISREDYRNIKDLCYLNNFDSFHCGFQTRNCFDLSNCSSIYGLKTKPSDLAECYFSESPSCSDGIKNCHDNSCEVLIDCGGSCDSCPTCSDGLKNQGELGIDCGGPCPWKCEAKLGPGGRSLIFIVLIGIFAVLLIVIIFKVVNLIKLYKKWRDNGKKKQV